MVLSLRNIPEFDGHRQMLERYRCETNYKSTGVGLSCIGYLGSYMPVVDGDDLLPDLDQYQNKKVT